MSSQNVVISHSEVDLFNTCERKHYYTWGENIEPKVKGAALSTGTLGHLIFQKIWERRQQGVSIEQVQDRIYEDLIPYVDNLELFTPINRIFINFFHCHS